MNTCPHCGHGLDGGESHCPHCGTEVKAIWPPTPKGQEPTAPPAPPNRIQVQKGALLGALLSVPTYYILGVAAFFDNQKRKYPHTYPGMHLLPVFRYGTWPINLVPLALVGLLYFTLRPRYPSFARGLGYCLLVITALLLYGLATCRN